MPPSDRFWADPFPLVRGGRCYVFFEELLFATGKAHISVVEVDRAGHVSEPRPVLACDYHLSYPFLVEDEGELYMIPETAAANRVEMWRCMRFPHRWERQRCCWRTCARWTRPCSATTGRWWLFANVAAEGASLNDELHLYSAPSLAGPWAPHPANPVNSDVRSARPAGRIYRRNGRLFRPAQVCAPLYGSGWRIHRIEKLTEREYAERWWRRSSPDRTQGILGLHTLNREGDFCVVDGFVRRRRA